MAPSLIDSYSKDLGNFPDCDSKTLIREGYIIAPRTNSLVRLSEYLLTGLNAPPYCLVATEVGCGTEGWFELYSQELSSEGKNEQQIIDQLLVSGMENEERDVVIARFVYQPYRFLVQDDEQIGMQIKGAFVHSDLEQFGLARTVYGFLLNWHDHIVCDNKQTVYGAKIWARGMLAVGRVQIYDANLPGFVDVLAEGGIGHGRLKPWDGLNLSQAQLSDWGDNHLNVESCTQIVNIISACDKKCVIGKTTYGGNLKKAKVSVIC
ncbi:hypothetical protein ACIPR9_16360 [Pectobacterium punjabense]|uniref:hypothetical protein n=1 Tax=Pectobacterium punjabense TaxID=2108399 RepID=UPI003821BA56